MTQSVIVNRPQLDELFAVLEAEGYELHGPTVRDQTIVYDRIYSTDDLPVGWTDQQAPGAYRLAPRQDRALFGYVVGPHSWKQYLFPPRQSLFTATSESNHEGDTQVLKIRPSQERPLKRAFIGVRSCEIAAMEVLDKVFLQPADIDNNYRVRRESSFIVAVNCGVAGENCFCSTMKTGPRVSMGFDLALTELLPDDRSNGDFTHYFVVEVGSDAGQRMIAQVTNRPATREELDAADEVSKQTVETITKGFRHEGVRELLAEQLESTQWQEIAERCLSCGNCTSVCPTCFCTNTQELTSVDGSETERFTQWDSCFNLEHSYIAGQSVRESTRSRYRQWITHKFSTWHDQFDVSGCVGCGRCITWCPVGIDVVEELQKLQEGRL